MGDRDVELGRFLRSRREAVRPENIALPTYGSRRVTGLRREELAMLAGVSVSYYTRIEQGQAGGVSAAVLDALARALGLGLDERAHLHRLGGDPQVGREPVPDEVLRPGLRGIVRGLREVPAGVLGRGMDLLTWNRAAHAIFAPHLPFAAVDDPVTRPNWAHALFTDDHSRDVFVEWERNAIDIVGRLRAAGGRNPGDPLVEGVVKELRATSPDFERLWRRHPVQEKPLGLVRLRHPLVGEFVLFDEVLRSAEDPDQVLVTMHAQPGSPDAAALARIVDAANDADGSVA